MEHSEPREKALEGLRVLDIATVYAAPFAACLLAEFGAEVLKVELPGRGDDLRRMEPSYEGVPLWWAVDNRNKRGITLDLRKPKGQEIFKRLVALSDVVIENFRPGTLERWGLGYEELKRVLGLSWGTEGDESPVAIPWEIRSGSEVVAQGAGRGKLGGWSRDEVIVRLGSFESEEDREYTISARVERSIEDLLGHRTEIAVEADPMYFKNAVVGAYVRQMVGLVCVALPGGVVFLVGGVLWTRRRRRATAPPT